MSDLDDQLKAVDPARDLEDSRVSPVVHTSWAKVRSSRVELAPRRNWKLLIPAGVVVAMVSTGAAIVAPFWFSIGEKNMQVEPDAQIPISYTTVSGAEVNCTYSVYVGADNRTDAESSVATALADTDWTGVGQEIYDHAIANPRSPQPNEDWTEDSQETRDTISFKLSIVPVIEQRLPTELQGVAAQWRSTDTCNGPFR